MASNYFNQAFAPFQAQSASRPSPMDLLLAAQNNHPGSGGNALARILGNTGPAPSDGAAPVTVSSSPVSQPRQRRSILDILGGVADTFATVGGAPALYQQGLDAQAERARQIDLDAMRQQQFDLAQRTGEQGLRAGEVDIRTGERGLENDERSRIGAALGGLIGAEDVSAIWPQIAQQAGIDPTKAAAIGQALQQNPEMLGPLASSFGYAAPKAGSQAKELQVYQLLQERDPEAAAAYLQNLSNPDAMTENQNAMLSLALAKFGLDQDRFNEDQRQFEIKQEASGGGGEGANLTPTQRGVVTQKLKLLPATVNQLSRVKSLATELERDGTLARGAIGGMVPGQVAGGKAEQFDKAVALLMQQITGIIRTPGVGSMSDYETRLQQATVPSRWGSDGGRAESIRNLEVLLQTLGQGYNEMVGPASRPAPRAAPRPSGRSTAQPRQRVGGESAAMAEARRRGLVK